MKANMLDVLLYMFEHYDDSALTSIEVGSSHPLALFNETRRLEEQLANQGFEDKDIDMALRWLEDLGEQVSALPKDDVVAPTAGGIRVFAPQEINLLGVECCDFVLELENNQVITAAERELILGRAVALDFKEIELDLEQFQWITLMVLANIPEAGDAYDWVEELIYCDASQLAN